MNRSKKIYVWDEKLIDKVDRLPAVVGRASLVHNLITAYRLLNHLQIVRSQDASYSDLKEFHSELYLDHLKTLKELDNDYTITEQDEQYGIGYDCPPVSNMFDLVTSIAGSSITAAKCLMLGLADVVINWCGGWHHANRFGAEGFCYINDIVIAIEKLKIKFPKILYVDLDVHHGNGVQDAYNLSKSVFTLSFHKYEPGFYPGSGSVNDIGTLNGKGFACNVPLQEKYSDKTLEYVFDRVFNLVYSHFLPDAIVVQCGADALAHDPHGGACVTIEGYCACVRKILAKAKPTLLLGGGGYNYANTARLWTALTALTVDVTLDENIPEHDQWPQFGPDYTLNVQPSLAKDINEIHSLNECIDKIKANIMEYVSTKVLPSCEPHLNIAKKIKRKTTNRLNDSSLLTSFNMELKSSTSDVYEFNE